MVTNFFFFFQFKLDLIFQCVQTVEAYRHRTDLDLYSLNLSCWNVILNVNWLLYVLLWFIQSSWMEHQWPMKRFYFLPYLSIYWGSYILLYGQPPKIKLWLQKSNVSFSGLLISKDWRSFRVMGTFSHLVLHEVFGGTYCICGKVV